MSSPYSEATQKILDDFLASLGARQTVDPDILAELRQAMGDGTLDSRNRIRQTVANLKAKADELYD